MSARLNAGAPTAGEENWPKVIHRSHSSRSRTLIPLEIGGVDISFTNSALIMVAVAIFITGFMLIGMRQRAVVPGRFQGAVEFFHDYVHGLIAENIGAAGKRISRSSSPSSSSSCS